MLTSRPAAASPDGHRPGRSRMVVGVAVSCLLVLIGVGVSTLEAPEPTPDLPSIPPVAADPSPAPELASPPVLEDLSPVVMGEHQYRFGLDENFAVMPYVGPAIEVSVLMADNAPRPDRFDKSFSGDGAHYVFSTAPRTTDRFARADTLYVYDIDDRSWSHVQLDGWRVFDVELVDEKLHALAIPTEDDFPKLALGTSLDRGETWSWSQTDALFPMEREDSYAHFAAAHSELFAIVQKVPNPGSETIALAEEAGLDMRSFDVVNADLEGLTIVSHEPEDATCTAIVAARGEATSDLYAPYGELHDAFFVPGRSTDQLHLLLTEMADLDDALRPQATEIKIGFEAQLESAGCSDRVRCHRIGWQVVHEARPGQAAIEAQLLALDDNFEASGAASIDDYFSSAAYQQMDAIATEQQSGQTEAINAAQQDAGCETGWYYGPDQSEDDDYQTMTWAELGVDIPRDWMGSSNLYRVTDTDLERIPGGLGNETVIRTEVDDRGLRFVTVPHNAYFRFHLEADEVYDQSSDAIMVNAQGTEWAFPEPPNRLRVYDRTWASAGTNQFLVYWNGRPEPLAPDATELPTPGLQDPSLHILADGTWAAVEFAELGIGDLDGRQLAAMVNTPFGAVLTLQSEADGIGAVVVWSTNGTDWERHDLTAGSVRPMPSGDGVLLFDGERGSQPAEIFRIGPTPDD